MQVVPLAPVSFVRLGLIPAIFVVFTWLAGCSADKPMNPSFPLTMSDARAALRKMEASPKPLERPVVVLAGIHDPGLIAAGLARRIKRLGDHEPVLSVSFFGADTFHDCRSRVLDRIQSMLADDLELAEIEVDVVAISMGGLIARYAAMPLPDDSRQLRIRRLFTISTPHRGAKLAALPTFDQRQIDMRPGSAFLASLDDALADADYDLLPYVRLDDVIVGEYNAAPEGRGVWWVANPPFSLSHCTASDDSRLLADIARRLRGEPPFTRSPPTPLPGSGQEGRRSGRTTAVGTGHGPSA